MDLSDLDSSRRLVNGRDCAGLLLQEQSKSRANSQDTLNEEHKAGGLFSCSPNSLCAGLDLLVCSVVSERP
jgi:hypothetical protein